jgi:peptide chain release factor 3
MKAINGRTGKPLTMSYSHELFGQQRETLDRAFPGDIIGLVNAGDLRVGDTLYVGDPVRFPPIRTLTPDNFVRVRSRDTSSYKQFRRGLAQLDEEGVVHVLHDRELGVQSPILAGAGRMQFEVAHHRLEHEFGAQVAIEPLDWQVSRRIEPDSEGIDSEQLRGRLLERGDGLLLAVFRHRFELERFERAHPDAALDPFLS